MRSEFLPVIRNPGICKGMAALLYKRREYFCFCQAGPEEIAEIAEAVKSDVKRFKVDACKCVHYIIRIRIFTDKRQGDVKILDRRIVSANMLAAQVILHRGQCTFEIIV